MGMAFMYGAMVIDTRESGERASETEMDLISSQMEINT